MTQYGLIGKSLGHSFSPGYFKDKFEKLSVAADYTAIEIADESLLQESLLGLKNYKGLNVTIPYKTAVIPFLGRLDAAAAAIGAVNCIDIKDGAFVGYNTDWIGFRDSLMSFLKSNNASCERALIFGNGGAAQAVKYALQQMDIAYAIVTRKGGGDYLYEELDASILNAFRLLINTTPIGMYPHVEQAFPIDSSFISRHHLLYDLIYNPELTSFLKMGLQQGVPVKNGLEMLHLQAEAAWRIWQGA